MVLLRLLVAPLLLLGSCLFHLRLSVVVGLGPGVSQVGKIVSHLDCHVDIVPAVDCLGVSGNKLLFHQLHICLD